MPEALARSHNDFTLSRPARQTPGKSRLRAARAVVMWLLSLPARSIAGAALAAVLVGIVVNALALQKERHPAPLFAGRPAASAPMPAPPPAQTAMAPVAAALPDAATLAVQPPARPGNLGASPEAAAPLAARSGDPIRDLLRGDGAKEPPHLTLAAQNALIKLGYSLKANGIAGPATLAAIQQFEKSRGLPPSSEITAKLVKQLTAAAASEN